LGIIIAAGHADAAAMRERASFRFAFGRDRCLNREITMNRRSISGHVAALGVFAVVALASGIVWADEKPYTEGTIWYISMIHVKPGMLDVYMRDVVPLRKKINEEAKKQGLVLSSHILSGLSAGTADFDVMFIEEYKNWAAFDGISAKYDAIANKIVGPEDKQVQLMTKRLEIREIVGEKVMQELLPK